MGKKRDKANDNIELLIEELIDARREALGDGNCPYRGTCPAGNQLECSECKEKYYEDMKYYLMKKYVVK